MTVAEMIAFHNDVLDRINNELTEWDDPLEQLALLTHLVRSTELLRTNAVWRSRGEGASWEAIGRAALVTRQAAWERWAGLEGPVSRSQPTALDG